MLGAVALLAAGYRVRKGESNHERTIESLVHTLGPECEPEQRVLRVARKRRHLIEYQQAGVVTTNDVESLRLAVARLEDRVLALLTDGGF
jgi:hypothetical protein